MSARPTMKRQSGHGETQCSVFGSSRVWKTSRLTMRWVQVVPAFSDVVMTMSSGRGTTSSQRVESR
jgi:hypothetical protein